MELMSKIENKCKRKSLPPNPVVMRMTGHNQTSVSIVTIRNTEWLNNHGLDLLSLYYDFIRIHYVRMCFIVLSVSNGSASYNGENLV